MPVSLLSVPGTNTRARQKCYGREEEFLFELRQPRDANYQTYLILGTEPSSLSAAALRPFRHADPRSLRPDRARLLLAQKPREKDGGCTRLHEEACAKLLHV